MLGRALFLIGAAVSALTPVVSAIAPVSAPVVVGRGSYMRVTPLDDGSLLGGYAAAEGDTKTLVVVKSTTGGASWEEIGEVTQTKLAEMDTDNAFVLQLPSKRILMAFRNHDRVVGTDGFSYYRLTLCASDDGGVTWFFLSQIEERAAAADKNGLWEPLLRIARNGDLQVYYSAENRSSDQDNLMKVSQDGGKTWSEPRTVSGAGIESRDGMVGIAEMDNGTLVCVFEATENGTPFSINAVLSHDDGATWVERRRVYTTPNGREAGAPWIVNVGGTLVVSFMTTEDDGGSGVDGGRFKVVTSTDASSWSAPELIAGPDAHWPGMLALSDTTFLTMYGLKGQLMTREYSI